MTIAEAIKHLEFVAKKFGPTIEVFFDCPNCGTAFGPSTVITQAVHLTAEKDKK